MSHRTASRHRAWRGGPPRRPGSRRHPHQNAFALLMDSFASMSVILMTLTFTFWVLDKL